MLTNTISNNEQNSQSATVTLTDQTDLHLQLLAHDQVVVKAGNNIYFVYDRQQQILYHLDKVKAIAPDELQDEQGYLIWKDGRSKWAVSNQIKNVTPDQIQNEIEQRCGKKDIFVLVSEFSFDANKYNGFSKDFATGVSVLCGEIDNLSFEEQWQFCKKFEQETGIELSVVNSGGKSLHFYIQLETPVKDFEIWKRLQKKLICIFNSDTSIRKATQEMRLAGCYRYSKETFQTLEKITDQSYSLEYIEKQLDNFDLFPYGLNEKRFQNYQKVINNNDDTAEEKRKNAVNELLKAPEQEKPKKSNNVVSFDRQSDNSDNSVKNINSKGLTLFDLMCPSDQTLIEEGELKGNRNNKGFSLACRLLKVADFLAEKHIEVEGDPYRLFLEFCFNCEQDDWNEQEWNTIYGSAKQSYQNTTINEKIIENKIKKYLKQHDPDEYKKIIKQKVKKQGLDDFTYSIDHPVNQRYFPDLILEENSPISGILNLIGTTGTGKSTQIKSIINQLRERNKNVVSISPTISLCKNQAFSWKVTFWNDAKDFSKGVTLCWDSLLKLKPYVFSNVNLILDEVESGIKHLLTSTTITDKNTRDKILKEFEHIVKRVYANGNLIILSDAHLSNMTVDYIKSFIPDAAIYTVKNNCNPYSWEIDLHQGSKEDTVLNKLYDALNENQKCLLAIDSKNTAEAEADLIRQKFPEKKIHLVSQDTAGEDQNSKYITQVNNAIAEEKPDLLIYTSVMGVGIDITEKHFDLMFGLFYGVLPSREIRQMLGRDRNAIKRIIWIANRGIKHPEDEQSWFIDGVKQRLLQKLEDIDLLDLVPTVKNESDYFDDYKETILETVQNLQEKIQNPHVETYCKIKARQNWELHNLYSSVKELLEQENHQINELESTKNEDGDLLKEQKKLKQEQKAKTIANAPEISEELYDELKQKNHKTFDEQAKVLKYIYQKDLPKVELSESFVLENIIKNEKLNAHKLFWLCQNRQFSKEKDVKHWINKINSWMVSEVCYVPDIKTNVQKVNLLLDKINIFQFLDLENPSKTFSVKDAEFCKFYKDKIYKFRKQIKELLGVTVTKDPNIQVFSNICRKIGIQFKNQRKRDQNNMPYRVYWVDQQSLQDKHRQDILASLDHKAFSAQTNSHDKASKKDDQQGSDSDIWDDLDDPAKSDYCLNTSGGAGSEKAINSHNSQLNKLYIKNDLNQVLSKDVSQDERNQPNLDGISSETLLQNCAITP